MTLQFRDNAGQLRTVTEMAPKSPFLCVNRSPLRYGFHAGAKTIRYRANIALREGQYGARDELFYFNF